MYLINRGQHRAPIYPSILVKQWPLSALHKTYLENSALTGSKEKDQAMF